MKRINFILLLFLIINSSYSQPLTPPERKWLINQLGELQADIEVNMLADLDLLMEKTPEPDAVMPTSIEKIDALIKKYPDSLELYKYRMKYFQEHNMAAKARNELDSAFTYFTSKLHADPKNFKYAKAVGELYYVSNDIEQGAKFWASMVPISSNNIKYVTQAMRFYLLDNDIDTAKLYRDIAFLVDGTNSELLLWEFYMQMMMLNQKLLDVSSTTPILEFHNLNSVIRSHPESRIARIVKYSLGTWEEFAKAMAAAANFENGRTVDSSLRSIYALRKNEITALENNLLEMLKVKKQNSYMLYSDLMLLNMIKQDSVAILKYYQMASRLMPGIPHHYRTMAMYYAHKNNYALSYEYLLRSANTDHDANDYSCAFKALYISKGADSAMAFLNKNENYFTNHSEWLIRKALTSIALARDNEALSLLGQIAGEDKKTNADMITWYSAAAYLGKGDRKKAGELFKSLIASAELWPQSKAVRLHFGLE